MVDETSRKICDFIRVASGRDIGVTLLQIAQGTALNLDEVCNRIHHLVIGGYLRRLYVRPAAYQWAGRPLPSRPASPTCVDRSDDA
ncbi:hypothetical protein [Burkholderia sp. RF4-BP95]|uniref:hypothetical protein n=1 Tax=Burkholderia sp. RF4-BP95 TaxID=1637845 RepID=UPI000B19A4A7|nr:hypothetical protein [Burkholderia sp. RF4-BP95]